MSWPWERYMFRTERSPGAEGGGYRLLSWISLAQVRSWLPLAVILLFTLTLRLLRLDLFYTRDEVVVWRWSDEFFVSLWRGDLAHSVLGSNYPAVTIFWLQSIYNYLKFGFVWLTSGHPPTLEAIIDVPHTLTYLAERRMVMGLATSVQVAGIYVLATKAFNQRLAILAAFLVALDPFLLAESRVLRAEALAAGFMILSILSWLVYLRDSKWRYAALSGLFAGWAMLTKMSSILLVPIVGLLLLFDLLLAREGTWKTRLKLNVKRGAMWGSLALVTFWLSWPTLWFNPWPPLETILVRAMIQANQSSVWHGDVFFAGRLIPSDPGLLFYPVVVAFRSTPLMWLGVVLGLFLLVRTLVPGKQPPTRQGEVALGERWSWPVISIEVLFTYILVILVGLSLMLSKVDRYLIPVFVGLDILTAVGLGWLLGWTGSREYNSRWMGIIGVVAIFVVQVALTWSAYPYFYSYWNPLVGGGPTAVETLPVGSGEGLDRAIDVLNQLPDAEHLTLICGASHGWCDGKFVGITWPYEVLNSGRWMKADYVLPYISWSQRQMYPQGVMGYLSRHPPVYQVELGGATYAWLYRVPDLPHYSGTKLEGRGTLYGYDLSATELRAGEGLTATLYWRNEGQLPEDDFFVELEDAAGYRWAMAYAEPRPGFEEAARTREEIVESEARLRLPVGMPPGHYFLKMGFVTGGGQTMVGRFELPDDGDDVMVTLPDAYPDADEVEVPHRVDWVTQDVSLLGYDLRPGEIEVGERGWLTLYWRAERGGPRDYVIGIRLLALDGEEATYWLGRPVYSGYAMSKWVRGQVVQDPWELGVPEEVRPGEYELELVLFDGESGEPLARTSLATWSVIAP
jgi:hypothetical protein